MNEREARLLRPPKESEERREMSLFSREIEKINDS